MAVTLSKPPKTMGQSGRELWQTLTNEFELDDAASRATLLQVCQCADRLTEISKHISADGLVIDTKTGPRDHPLLKSEVACRSFMIRGLQRLGHQNQLDGPAMLLAGCRQNCERGECKS